MSDEPKDEHRMLRQYAEIRLRGAFESYLNWQAAYEGQPPGDANTFLDWVRDELLPPTKSVESPK
jgi:hypothetical protein